MCNISSTTLSLPGSRQLGCRLRSTLALSPLLRSLPSILISTTAPSLADLKAQQRRRSSMEFQGTERRAHQCEPPYFFSPYASSREDFSLVAHSGEFIGPNCSGDPSDIYDLYAPIRLARAPKVLSSNFKPCRSLHRSCWSSLRCRLRISAGGFQNENPPRFPYSSPAALEHAPPAAHKVARDRAHAPFSKPFLYSRKAADSKEPLGPAAASASRGI